VASKVTALKLWLHYEPKDLTLDYTPVVVDEASGATRPIEAYRTQFQTSVEQLPEPLQRNLGRLWDYVLGNLDVPEIEVGHAQVRGDAHLSYVQIRNEPGRQRLSVSYSTNPRNITGADILISDAASRLIENLWPMCEQRAWNHLRQMSKVPIAPSPTGKRKVLISYRKTRAELRDFAEAIAHRLGREGFMPWFDEWEIRAGDSIARELEGALHEVYGIVIVLSQDYPGERWAREELEGAITKRVEQGIRVIPILYEACERPELLRALSYVDCTDHNEEQFERQFLKIIDALNEIEMNPYRA
jgi:TIR domain